MKTSLSQERFGGRSARRMDLSLGVVWRMAAVVVVGWGMGVRLASAAQKPAAAAERSCPAHGILPSRAPFRYVSAGNMKARPPYTSWTTAAATIQAAVDAAGDGAVVLVGPGVYDGGGVADPAGEMNRLMITKAISVIAMGGPSRTTIVGSGFDGGDPVRCAYVANALLAGFTLTGGSASSGGGVFCDWGAKILGCVIVSNASGWGGGACGSVGDSVLSTPHGERNAVAGTLAGCRVADNVGFGAGCIGVVSDCVIEGNSDAGLYHVPVVRGSRIAGNMGGGASNPGFGLIETCEVSGNSSPFSGGGIAGFHTVRGCTVESNSAGAGAGIAGMGLSIVENCRVRGNTAWSFGGGIWDAKEVRTSILEGNSAFYGGGYFGQGFGRLVGCLIAGNRAEGRGGGVYDAFEIENCTLVNNEAGISGGGVTGFYIHAGFAPQRILNSILSGNAAPVLPDAEVLQAALFESANAFNCIPPTPGFPAELGNIADDPVFAADSFRPGALSPCVDAGANAEWMAGTVDLDGRPRILNGRVDIGAYEFPTPKPCGDRERPRPQGGGKGRGAR